MLDKKFIKPKVYTVAKTLAMLDNELREFETNEVRFEWHLSRANALIDSLEKHGWCLIEMP